MPSQIPSQENIPKASESTDSNPASLSKIPNSKSSESLQASSGLVGKVLFLFLFLFFYNLIMIKKIMEFNLKVRKGLLGWLYPEAHDASENLGTENKAYFDNATGRWVFPGEVN